MKSKKLIIDILIILLAFIIFVFWYEKNKSDYILKTAAFNKSHLVYLITMEKQSEFWERVNEGSADMARLLGITYQWRAPETLNTDRQIEILNQVVSEGAEAILIAVNDAVRLSEPIREAKAKGVVIIYVDAPAEEEALVTLATNNHEAGRIAGENMISELELEGIQEGKLGIVSVSLTNRTTILREQGFREVIEADGRFTMIDTVYTLGDPAASQGTAAHMIAENADLVGIFGTNEGSSEGVGNALQADRNRLVGIGFDRSARNYDLLNEGSFRALIDQNPYTMGYLGMAEAYAALEGFDTGPSYINTGVTVLLGR